MARRTSQKSEDAYRTISEVADELEVPQHVLRFWESKFKQLEPLKRAGGRRYYKPHDMDLLKKIHFLLYTKGYTIKGVQKLLANTKNITSELVGISEHFLLKTEPRPVDVMKEKEREQQVQEKQVSKEIFQANDELPFEFPDEKKDKISPTVVNALKEILSELKSIQEQLDA